MGWVISNVDEVVWVMGARLDGQVHCRLPLPPSVDSAAEDRDPILDHHADRVTGAEQRILQLSFKVGLDLLV